MIALLRRLYIVLYLARRIVVQVGQLVYQTHSLASMRILWTSLRLSWLALRSPRSVPGTFRFPFGRVRYLDALSLLGQYCGIFVDRGYDVIGLGDAPNIIDCGGNIGLSVIWFKRRYPRATITVYEADPAVAALLEHNVKALGLGSVTVIRAAVGDSRGRVAFTSDGIDGGRVTDEGSVSVESVRLSDSIREPVDILKIDVEGSEFSLIEDICASGRIALVKTVMCEIHGRNEARDQFARLWTNLSSAGFHITVNRATNAEWLPGSAEPSPFPAVASAKFVMDLYAWRPR